MSLAERMRAAQEAAEAAEAAARAATTAAPEAALAPTVAAPSAPPASIAVAPAPAAAVAAPAAPPAPAPAEPGSHRGPAADAGQVPAAPRDGVPEVSSLATRRAAVGGNDRFAELKSAVHGELLKQLGPQLYEADVPSEELGAKVRTTLKDVLAGQDRPLSAADRAQVTKEITDDILGYGPIETLLADPDVTEVMVNGPSMVFVERKGRLTLSDVQFDDDAHLRRIIDKIVSRIGRRVDESSPMVDARLPDGSRVNAVIPPLAIDGSALTIRKFATDPFTVQDLIDFGSLSQRTADFLEACVRGKLNIIVSGSTGAGKTTTLNVLSSFIPNDERIVTIEDAAELQLKQEHVVRLESRPPNIEGKGAVTIRDLVKNSLRMRPDRIVVGEVRDASALDMLQAMNTGHDGSITTLHSNGPRDTLSRMETLVLMAGMDLPIRAIREQVASAVDLIVHQSRLRDGSRRITHVTEVERMEGDVITLQDIFVFDHSRGFDAEGRSLGGLRSTGLRPKFLEKMANANVRIDPLVFARDGVA